MYAQVSLFKNYTLGLKTVPHLCERIIALAEMKDHFIPPLHSPCYSPFFLGWGLRGLPVSGRFARQVPSSFRERGCFSTHGPCLGPARLSVICKHLLSIGCRHHTLFTCSRQHFYRDPK
jgi:hypothetical protein